MYLSLESSCYGSKIEDAGDHRFTIQVWGTIPEGQELDLEDEECGTSEVFVIAWLARLALESDQRFPVAMQMWPSGIAVFKSGLASRIVFDVFVPRFTLGALLAMGSGPRSVERNPWNKKTLWAVAARLLLVDEKQKIVLPNAGMIMIHYSNFYTPSSMERQRFFWTLRNWKWVCQVCPQNSWRNCSESFFEIWLFGRSSTEFNTSP